MSEELISRTKKFAIRIRGRSDKDFLSRITIAEEEADETIYWLELLIEAGIVTERKLRLLLQEAKELTAILTSAGKTKKQNMKLQSELKVGSRKSGN